jgi:hypothetical protein
MREAGRTLQPPQQHQVLSLSAQNGLPLYLKLVFEEARHWKSYDLESALSPDIPGIIGALFSWLSRPQNHGEVLVAHSLAYLAAGKNGLTEDELLDILSTDETVMADFQRHSPKSPPIDRLPVVVWSRLYFDLESYLTEQSADNSLLLIFYHQQLREPAKRLCLGSSDAPEAHRRLADYFAGRVKGIPQPNHFKEAEGNQSPNYRKLSELPFQLAMSLQLDDLYTLLTNFDFLEGKAATGRFSIGKVTHFGGIYNSCPMSITF